jgi:hypothetical protein
MCCVISDLDALGEHESMNNPHPHCCKTSTALHFYCCSRELLCFVSSVQTLISLALHICPMVRSLRCPGLPFCQGVCRAAHDRILPLNEQSAPRRPQNHSSSRLPFGALHLRPPALCAGLFGLVLLLSYSKRLVLRMTTALLTCSDGSFV